MKYFTPERVVAYGSDDEETAMAAAAEWDTVGEEYARYLEAVKQHFPAGLRRIEESYYLHDAAVLGIGQAEKQYTLLLRLDTPPRSLLVFRYGLVEEPTVNRDALPEVGRLKGEPTWQYNELELMSAEPPVWRESLLLSNGWELTLTFRDVEVEELSPILPVPRAAARPRTEEPTQQKEAARSA